MFHHSLSGNILSFSRFHLPFFNTLLHTGQLQSSTNGTIILKQALQRYHNELWTNQKKKSQQCHTSYMARRRSNWSRHANISWRWGHWWVHPGIRPAHYLEMEANFVSLSSVPCLPSLNYPFMHTPTWPFSSVARMESQNPHGQFKMSAQLAMWLRP